MARTCHNVCASLVAGVAVPEMEKMRAESQKKKDALKLRVSEAFGDAEQIGHRQNSCHHTGVLGSAIEWTPFSRHASMGTLQG